jgi:hypothetical protein
MGSRPAELGRLKQQAGGGGVGGVGGLGGAGGVGVERGGVWEKN